MTGSGSDSFDVEIGGVKVCEKWDVNLVGIVIGMPEPVIVTVEIPGYSETADLSEVLTGDVQYNERTIQITFNAECRISEWHSLVSDMANHIHGRRQKVILDTDPNYYYIGRLTLDTQLTSQYTSQIVITGTVDPFKYELTSGMEDWLWDPFNFETDVIREYKDIQVDGAAEVIIPGLRKRVVPVIYASAAMQVTYNDKSYSLQAGSNKIYDIALPEGENTLTFTGNGTVSIDYRGGSL